MAVLEDINVNGMSITHTVIPIIGDGACLFNSLSFLLFNTQERSLEIRKRVVSYVVEKWNDFSWMSYNSNGDNFSTSAEYEREMSQHAVYAGVCELVAAGKIFPFCFEVYYNRILYETFGTNTFPVKRLRLSGNINSGHFDVYLPISELNVPIISTSDELSIPKINVLQDSLEMTPVGDSQNETRSRLGRRPKKIMFNYTRQSQEQIEQVINKKHGTSKNIITAQEKTVLVSVRPGRVAKSKSVKRIAEIISDLNDYYSQEADRKRKKQNNNFAVNSNRLHRMRNYANLRRTEESITERNQRLQKMRKQASQRRAVETIDSRQQRLEEDRRRHDRRLEALRLNHLSTYKIATTINTSYHSLKPFRERRSLSELNMRGMDRPDDERDHSVDVDHSALVATSSSAPVTVTAVPFHYLINEQAKSIIALQELQNEVSALLEFRDLVMETFPHLRQKMVSSTAPPTPSGIRQYHQGTVSHIPLATSLQGSPSGKPRDWEPGIRVKRKLHQNSREQETSVPSLVPRSRSNSHGKAPKSGEVNSSSSAGSSAVQDSGFCTESKEHCSTSSAATNSTSRKTDPEHEAEDELWNLLDLIHRKGTKLRLEVEYLQHKFDKCESNDGKRRTRSLNDLRTVSENTQGKSEGGSVLDIEVEGLRRERDLLLDRVTEMEAENLANLTQTNHLLAEMGVLNSEKRDLEDQLRTAISTKAELNSRIHDLHLQFVNRSENKFSKILHAPIAKSGSRIISNRLASSQILVGGSSCFTPVKRSLSNEDSVYSSDNVNTSSIKELNRLRQREDHPNRIKRTSKDLTVLKPSGEYSDEYSGLKLNQDLPSRLKDCKIDDSDISGKEFEFSPRYSASVTTVPLVEGVSVSAKCVHISSKLGTLDGVVSSPSSQMKGVPPDKEKVAAILKEFNVIELQRHLLTTTYENKVSQCNLEKLTESRKELLSQVDKIKEENEDLRFQLEEKSIELEGTRARIRLLERLQSSKMSSDLVENIITHSNTLLPASHESTPNPILTHLALPVSNNDDAIHNSSSTESAHNDDILEKRSESPRKRPPSKIPLKSYSAPKPPSGRINSSRNTPNGKVTKESMPSWGKKEKEKMWDPISRSMKEAPSISSKRESPIGRPSSRDSLSSVNRRVRKVSDNRLNQDVSFSSTNSTPSMRRDPPSSPAPKKIPPPRERIITSDQNEAKVLFSHNQLVSWRDYHSSHKQKAADFPDSLESEQIKLHKCLELSNLQSHQEQDRSISSEVPSKVWKCYSSSAEYFDSIDNSGSSVFQDANTSFNNVREGLAECDSLERNCSDVGDLV